MPFEQTNLEANSEFQVEGDSSLKSLISTVEDIANGLKGSATTFDGHVGDLRQSEFYTYMKNMQNNIIG